MSSRKGSGETRTRAQKHKNSFAFKNDLHDKTPQQKLINSLNVCEVCERCKAQIEWRIKYKKYKPLSQAKTCIRYVIVACRTSSLNLPTFSIINNSKKSICSSTDVRTVPSHEPITSAARNAPKRNGFVQNVCNQLMLWKSSHQNRHCRNRNSWKSKWIV